MLYSYYSVIHWIKFFLHRFQLVFFISMDHATLHWSEHFSRWYLTDARGFNEIVLEHSRYIYLLILARRQASRYAWTISSVHACVTYLLLFIFCLSEHNLHLFSSESSAFLSLFLALLLIVGLWERACFQPFSFLSFLFFLSILL